MMIVITDKYVDKLANTSAQLVLTFILFLNYLNVFVDLKKKISIFKLFIFFYFYRHYFY